MRSLHSTITKSTTSTTITRILVFFVSLVFLVSSPDGAEAAFYPTLTYRHDHHLFSIDPNEQRNWHKAEEVWTYEGFKIQPPAYVRVDGDNVPQLPERLKRSQRYVWDTDAIAETLDRMIAQRFNRPSGNVTIDRSVEGEITFDGVGFLGREIDLELAAELTIEALETGIPDIVLPVIETQPTVQVLDPDLQDMGIREVVAIGESDYSTSPLARRHNISTGLTKFDGHLVAQGDQFSFNDVLGPVNAETGYKEELVILGPLTLPAYGGGLCQISTTAYRGIWSYGFPIEKRKNHSFAVQYYAPQGTDATIYPPTVDMVFRNDSPGALLIQTHQENERAFFVYYGTRDDRSAEIIGPYSWDHVPAPPDKVEYTAELPLGTSRNVGKAVPGMKTAWFRVVRRGEDSEVVEPFYSYYEARPNYTQIGEGNVPLWIGN